MTVNTHVTEIKLNLSCFIGYLSYNKIELVKQFCVSKCGVYSVWEIPRLLERINVSSRLTQL